MRFAWGSGDDLATGRLPPRATPVRDDARVANLFDACQNHKERNPLLSMFVLFVETMRNYVLFIYSNTELHNPLSKFELGASQAVSLNSYFYVFESSIYTIAFFIANI